MISRTDLLSDWSYHLARLEPLEALAGIEKNLEELGENCLLFKTTKRRFTRHGIPRKEYLTMLQIAISVLRQLKARIERGMPVNHLDTRQYNRNGWRVGIERGTRVHKQMPLL